MNKRWLLYGLVASMALNLILLGFVGGRAFAHFAQPALGFDPAHRLPRLLAFLPKERRDELRPALRGYARGIHSSAKELKRSHRQMRQALRAEVFDAAALESALSGMRARLSEAQGVHHQQLVSLSARMSVDERRRLAERMTRRGWRHHRGQSPPPQGWADDHQEHRRAGGR